jgi:hypothetical protein
MYELPQTKIKVSPEIQTVAVHNVWNNNFKFRYSNFLSHGRIIS